MKERDWSQKDLAEVMGRPVQFISELLRGKRSLTVETAIQLEAALGIRAQFWLNREAQYRLWLLEMAESSEIASIEKRRKELEMQKAG